MAPRQKTFELIPSTPAGLQAPPEPGQQHPAQAHAHAQPVYNKPPMTTKQAKKLYRQANKGPKLSKAEQRRIELMEQDRIRKEFEKEKAQARARTAREKKKAREEHERDERKRKGLPLVDVRPSQDTISRFIRIGKRQASSAIENHLDSIREQDLETDSGAESTAKARYGQQHDAPDKKDDYESAEDDLETGRECKRPRYGQLCETNADEPDPRPNQHPPGTLTSIARQLDADPFPPDIQLSIDEAWEEELLEDQLAADVVPMPLTNAEAQDPAEESPATVSGLMPTHPSEACVLSASTQAFLLNNAEDMFPSSSQQARELADSFADDDGGFSSPEHQSQTSGSRADPPSQTPLEDEPAKALYAPAEPISPPQRPPFPVTEPSKKAPRLSTQVYILSSQDDQEIDTSSEARGPCGKGGVVESSAVDKAAACVSEARTGQPCQNPGGSEYTDAQQTAAQAPDNDAAYQASPPKKRMFGSSGPGFEVLVAMQRSHEQNQHERRIRERKNQAQGEQRQLHGDMIEHTSNLFMDVVGGRCAGEANGARGPRGEEEATAGATYQAECCPQDTGNADFVGGYKGPASSQETDYGDIDLNAALDILMRMERGQRT